MAVGFERMPVQKGKLYRRAGSLETASCNYPKVPFVNFNIDGLQLLLVAV